MKVYFIGAGPGAVDLITLRGLRILQDARMVLYAGSLVPVDLLKYCRTDAESVDTAKPNLDEQIAYYARARASNIDVARLHSGAPSISGATAEHMQRREHLGMTYEIVPGVFWFTAAEA